MTRFVDVQSSIPSIPQVPQAVDRLHTATLRLQESLSNLQVRLHAVTDVSAPLKPADTSVKGAPRVPLAAAIDEHSDMLESLAYEVEVLLGNIQL